MLTCDSAAKVKVHDLLEIEAVLFAVDLSEAPDWVAISLQATPFVVVRRAGFTVDGGIAIGVRGDSRSERWAGVLKPEFVKRVIAPCDLLRRSANLPEERRSIPALRSLIELEARWNSCGLLWGPGGSVGFELATGRPAASPSSDLDLVIFAPKAFDVHFARNLLSSLRSVSRSIDVIVETLTCGFLLEEYVSSSGGKVLLRSADNTRVGHPWDIAVTAPTEQTDSISSAEMVR